MADKLTQLIVDALSRAAADPTGLPLYASQSDPGLFPPTAAAKPAAKRAVDDGLLSVVGTDTKGKQTRELCVATDAGWRFLLDHASPKQVLEDFVRVLESRQGEVDDLLAAARHMADALCGLQLAVARVLPKVEAVTLPRGAAANGDADALPPAIAQRLSGEIPTAPLSNDPPA